MALHHGLNRPRRPGCLERAAAEQTAAIDADKQAADINDEIKRLQLLLIAERAATVAATAAADEAAATINNLEAENNAYCFCWRQRRQP